MPAMRLSSSVTAAAAMREMVWSGEATWACSSLRTWSARLSSATLESAWIASMRISRSGRGNERQQRVDQLGVAELAERAHHDRHRLAVARLAAFPSGAARRACCRSRRAHRSARSLTHQSLSRVAWMSESTARSSLVWLRISMAARRMSSSLSRTSCSTASMTFGPPILPSASAARLRTHQSLSLRASSRYLTDCGVADLVQHLDGGAARVLVLVLQHLDQVAAWSPGGSP